MNTIEIFTSFSEESLLAIVAFLGAGAFYMLRLTKIMRTRIQDYEERDLDGRDAFKNDVDVLHRIEERVRFGYQNVKDHVEEELVEYELASFALNPRLKTINTKIEQSTKKEAVLMDELQQRLRDVTRLMEPGAVQNTSLVDIRQALPKAIQIVSQMQQTMHDQNFKINQLNGNIKLIEKGYGVE